LIFPALPCRKKVSLRSTLAAAGKFAIDDKPWPVRVASFRGPRDELIELLEDKTGLHVSAGLSHRASCDDVVLLAL
jgi:hypothetical protein